MSDRDRFFFSAVGLALIAGLVSAGSINHERQRSGHYESAKEQYDSAHGRVTASASVIQSLITDVEAYRQEWREEQDLFAQRDMAKWAWLMMLASFAGVGVTAVGVVFVAQTLVATREAVAAANRTADEAKRIGEAQVRGYLSSDGGQFWLQQRFVWFELGVVNRGQSPIFGGDATGLLTIVQKGRETIQKDVLGRFDAASAGERRLCRIHITNESLPSQTLDALKRRDGATVILNLTFRWKDVFGVELWATYLFTQRDPAFVDASRPHVTMMYSAKLDAFCVAANWTGEHQHTLQP